MNVIEVHEIAADGSVPVPIASAYKFETYLLINKLAALPIARISNSIDTTSLIPITLGGAVIGDLIFTATKGDITFNTMTENEFIAYLTTEEISHYETHNSYEFLTDFLIIKEDYLIDYMLNHMDTSALWGGFIHKLTSFTPTARYKTSPISIEIGNELMDFNPYSYESIVRAIEQPYAFERFLKLYHLLELQFDLSIIDKIKSLSMPSDANLIGEILNEYSHTEISRLTDIIQNSCTDISALEAAMVKVVPFQIIAEEIFIKFGKSKLDIHLTDITKFQTVIASGSFSEANLHSLRIVADTRKHPKFIVSVCAYWIYRIRCSIAHNKIGEYLLSWTDENFIVEFGEPLLKAVLMQCFKK